MNEISQLRRSKRGGTGRRLAYRNNIPVTPGATYLVVAGSSVLVYLSVSLFTYLLNLAGTISGQIVNNGETSSFGYGIIDGGSGGGSGGGTGLFGKGPSGTSPSQGGSGSTNGGAINSTGETYGEGGGIGAGPGGIRIIWPGNLRFFPRREQ